MSGPAAAHSGDAGALPDAVIAELADAIGRALQDVYLTAAVAAALALGLGLRLPAALSLTRAPERP